jgi:hypothetical protein
MSPYEVPCFDQRRWVLHLIPRRVEDAIEPKAVLEEKLHLAPLLDVVSARGLEQTTERDRTRATRARALHGLGRATPKAPPAREANEGI